MWCSWVAADFACLKWSETTTNAIHQFKLRWFFVVQWFLRLVSSKKKKKRQPWSRRDLSMCSLTVRHWQWTNGACGELLCASWNVDWVGLTGQKKNTPVSCSAVYTSLSKAETTSTNCNREPVFAVLLFPVVGLATGPLHKNIVYVFWPYAAFNQWQLGWISSKWHLSRTKEEKDGWIDGFE